MYQFPFTQVPPPGNLFLVVPGTYPSVGEEPEPKVGDYFLKYFFNVSYALFMRVNSSVDDLWPAVSG